MAPQSSVSTKTDPGLVALIHDLKRTAKEQQAPVWKDLALRLEKPTRQRAAVNLSRLERNLDARDVAVVPGKLLSAGTLTKPVTVAAVSFSAQARAKVQAAGGQCLTIAELKQQNPTGAKVRILG